MEGLTKRKKKESEEGGKEVKRKNEEQRVPRTEGERQHPMKNARKKQTRKKRWEGQMGEREGKKKWKRILKKGEGKNGEDGRMEENGPQREGQRTEKQTKAEKWIG